MDSLRLMMCENTNADEEKRSLKKWAINQKRMMLRDFEE